MVFSGALYRQGPWRHGVMSKCQTLPTPPNSLGAAQRSPSTPHDEALLAQLAQLGGLT